MGGWKRGLLLVSLLLGIAVDVSLAQAPSTAVLDTVYRADGLAAGGTVVVSWGAFTTADGTAISAGTTTVTLGAGGVLSVSLAPNAGATPMGSYYTAVFHLNDGTVSREFWVVPVAVPGGGAAKLAGIRNQVLPTSVAMQTVSKAYVDTTVAKAVAGIAPVSSPFVLRAGDTLTGPLALPADPVNANQAADKNYVDENFAAATSGTVAAARLPVFGASGTGHAVGAVPDPGATAGSSRYLREDGSWSAPATGGGSGAPTGAAGGDLSGSYPNPVVSAVHATAGAGTSSLGEYYNGLGVSGSTNGTGNPIFGVLSSTQSGAGVGDTGFTVYDNNQVATHNNVLDDGTGRTVFSASGSAAYYGVAQFFAPNNTGSGAATQLQFGVAGACSNAAEWRFIYSSSGSPANAAGLAFTCQVNPSLTYYPNGRVITSNNTLDDGTGVAAFRMLSAGSAGQFQVDGSGNVSAGTYAGPASAPAGACAVSGVWVFSRDGHATFCNAGTWVEKI